MARLIFVFLMYIGIPLMQVLFYLQELPFFGFFETINYVCSILSFYAIFNHLLISVKIPRMQKFFPYDAMIKIHALSGILLSITIYFHGAFKIIIGKRIEGSTWVLLALWTFLLFLAILWIETPFSRRLRKALLTLIPTFAKVPYDLMKRIHGYLFIFMGYMVYSHVNEADFMFSSNPFIATYATYYPLAVFAIVAYSKFRKLFLPRLKVAEKRIVADLAVLSLVPVGNRKIHYRAGQYGYFRVMGKSIFEEEHPFSFLSTPGEHEIRVGIKMLGDYTKTIGELEHGSIIRINGGFGNFIPSYLKADTVLIGSGIGIVPLLSLLRHMKYEKPTEKVTAFLSVKSREELLYAEELLELERDIPNLSINTFVFEEDGILYSEEVFTNYVKNPAFCNFFLCSSPGVRNIVVKSLKSIGVTDKQIQFEAFSY